MGSYVGSFSVLGGSDANAQDVLATQNFLVTVTPEGGSGLLLLAGLVVPGAALALRRRRAT